MQLFSKDSFYVLLISVKINPVSVRITILWIKVKCGGGWIEKLIKPTISKKLFRAKIYAVCLSKYWFAN